MIYFEIHWETKFSEDKKNEFHLQPTIVAVTDSQLVSWEKVTYKYAILVEKNQFSNEKRKKVSE